MFDNPTLMGGSVYSDTKRQLCRYCIHFPNNTNIPKRELVCRKDKREYSNELCPIYGNIRIVVKEGPIELCIEKNKDFDCPDYEEIRP